MESIADHKKYLYPSKINVLEQFDENDIIRWRLNVKRTEVKDLGMLQPEHQKPPQVPSVAARLVGY